MDPDFLAARRDSFLSVTPDYERTRPGYPIEAIRWAFGAEPRTVVDLGCGPGKLTSQLAVLGHRVVGLDPSLSMLQGMRSKGLEAVAATAEAIPLRSECAEVVTAAQAFHWFDAGKAVPEMRRVVRRDGRVVLVWNFRDETVEWVRQLSEIIGSEDAMVATTGGQDEFEMEIRSRLLEGGLFGAVEHEVFPHDQEINEESLVGLVRSRSYVAILPDSEKKQLLARVRRLCSEHPALVGRPTFRMPYRTRVFRATPL